MRPLANGNGNQLGQVMRAWLAEHPDADLPPEELPRERRRAFVDQSRLASAGASPEDEVADAEPNDEKLFKRVAKAEDPYAVLLALARRGQLTRGLAMALETAGLVSAKEVAAAARGAPAIGQLRSALRAVEQLFFEAARAEHLSGSVRDAARLLDALGQTFRAASFDDAARIKLLASEAEGFSRRSGACTIPASDAAVFGTLYDKCRQLLFLPKASISASRVADALVQILEIDRPADVVDRDRLRAQVKSAVDASRTSRAVVRERAFVRSKADDAACVALTRQVLEFLGWGAQRRDRAANTLRQRKSRSERRQRARLERIISES